MSAPSPNTSFYGEPIHLAIGSSYFVIDALYLDDIILNSHKIDKKNIENSIRNEVFPFPNTNFPFAKFFTKKVTFHPNQLVRIKSKEVTNFDKTRILASDTGLLLFINQDIFLDLVLNNNYTYDALVASMTTEINFYYWDFLTAKFGTSNLGIIRPVFKLENSTYMGGGGKFFIAEQP
jgi:hypothetical protein